MPLLDISTFVGRFHPLVVHLPIGFLILALLLDLPLVSKKRNSTSFVWLFSFVTSLVAVLLGFLLANSGHYIEDQLSIHKWSGIFLVLLCGVGWIARSSYFTFSTNLRVINNLLVVFTLVVVGHNGGVLTHGKNYLFENGPEWLKNRFVQKYEVKDFSTISLDSLVVYKDLIQPLFDQKCTACHNENVKRGGLDMTTSKSLLKGGKSGAAIVQKSLSKSLVYNRITKEQTDQKFMPPTNVPLTYSEIKLIEWWILEGAPVDSPLSKQKITPDIQNLLLKNYALDSREKPWYEKVELEPLKETDYSRLEQLQFSWRKLSEENPLLDIRFQGISLTEESIEVLGQYAPYITWLNLSEANVQNNALEAISKMENLTRLYLQNNPLLNAELDLLISLTHLEILNLHSTKIDQSVFEVAKQLPSLKKLFLWNTPLTNTQIESQQSFFPNTTLIGGLE
jgi:uncharacterized membrane protein